MKNGLLNTNNVFDYIIACIPSKSAGEYIRKNRDNYNILQLATLVEEYVKTHKSECFDALKEMTSNLYEKKLLNYAANDYKKHKFLSDKTNNFYVQNDPRGDDKPLCCFSEICDFPVLFKAGDIICVMDGNRIRHAVIGKIPNPIDYTDFSGPTYLAYMLDESLDCDNCLFKVHAHLHVCEVDKATTSLLSETERHNLEMLIPLIKDFWGWSKNR